MLHGGRKVLDGPVDDIKAERGREHVRVRYRDPVGDLSTLPGVVRIQDLGREQILELGPAANPRDLLIALGQLGTLLRYEVNHPSLHEIFVEIAGVHAEVPNA
jgi:ABC-2 type transport system ATP-binding protein